MGPRRSGLSSRASLRPTGSATVKRGAIEGVDGGIAGTAYNRRRGLAGPRCRQTLWATIACGSDAAAEEM